ncbi:MAG TPA: hypothetical protein VGQ83_26450 [Polyangia bacterium]
MADPVPYWILISILFSSLPLSEAVARRLHQAALELYRRDEGVTRIVGELAQGEVRNLKKDLLIGTLGGSGFEAQLDTERGSGTVRFLLTRQGLELLAEADAPPPHTLN